jgi:chemotaxis protein methyltransferase CheR
VESREGGARTIDRLLATVLRRCGRDFGGYARASIDRRARAFATDRGFGSIDDLTDVLLRDDEVLSRLIAQLTVPGSEMFRDPAVFLALRERVAPMLRTWPHVRVWCAGCASGEEAWSLAILFKEEGLFGRTRVYATDCDDAALARARLGILPIDCMQGATRRYQESGGLRSFSDYYHARYEAAILDSSLADRITFARHDLVSDEVFGEMHLVLCRNVLIYFGHELQARATRLFERSLVHGGFLCLGARENLRWSPVADRFAVADTTARIYRKTAPGDNDDSEAGGGR